MKIISFLLVYILMILSGCSFIEAQNTLSPEEFESKLKTEEPLQLIDVRTAEEFSQGYIQDARNMDYYDPLFKDRIQELDTSQPVFVYCRSGSRSAKAAQLFKEEGFLQVYDLAGGILNWEKDKLVTVK